MNFTESELPEVWIVEPRVVADSRGYFLESYREVDFIKNIGMEINFLQDNESMSQKGVLRGLHYQLPPFSQSKLVRVIKGGVLDVAVDIRKGSPNFGRYILVDLNEENKKQLFIPRGFAHGFLVTRDNTIFSYKVDNYYSPEYERGICFNDTAIGIDWKMNSEYILSVKDQNLPVLKDAEIFSYDDILY